MHTVLVVEPSPALRSAIVDLIQPPVVHHGTASSSVPMGCNIVQAKDGYEALLHLPRASYDLIIVNEALPDISGFSVLSFVRKNPMSQHTPVLMLEAAPASDEPWTQTPRNTDRPDQQRISQAHALGADAFIAQPVDVAILRDTVRSLLKGRQHG